MLYLEILYASIVLLVMAVIAVVVYIIQFYDLEPLVTTKTPEEPPASEPDKIV
tara:strand:- start:1032 stop:1190 length:159 start_codon:yes stop_codon:yes gene_type:complete